MSKTLSGRGESHQNCGVGETPSGNVDCIVFFNIKNSVPIYTSEFIRGGRIFFFLGPWIRNQKLSLKLFRVKFFLMMISAAI